MKKATVADKQHIVNLLSSSFADNKSVNYIVPQDKCKESRLHALMDYSFEVCRRFGAIYLSDDRNACALVMFPDQKKTTLTSVWLDIKLIFQAVGIGGIFKTVKREAAIKKMQPELPMYYLWFIGVDPFHQHRGAGTALIEELIKDAAVRGRPVYLETSTEANLPWYKRSGFEIYGQLDLGYVLYFLRQIQ